MQQDLSKYILSILLLHFAVTVSSQNSNATIGEVKDADISFFRKGDAIMIDTIIYMLDRSPLVCLPNGKELDSAFSDLYENYDIHEPYWGRRLPSKSFCGGCNWRIIEGKLFLEQIFAFTPFTAEPDVEDVKMRLEKFTKCRFDAVTGTMFASWVSGELYAKIPNTILHPELRSCDNPKYMEINEKRFLEWIEEPIYRLIFVNGELVSFENFYPRY